MKTEKLRIKRAYYDSLLQAKDDDGSIGFYKTRRIIMLNENIKGEEFK